MDRVFDVFLVYTRVSKTDHIAVVLDESVDSFFCDLENCYTLDPAATATVTGGIEDFARLQKRLKGEKRYVFNLELWSEANLSPLLSSPQVKSEPFTSAVFVETDS